MPDLAAFETRERQRINGTFGCLMGAAVVLTVVLILAIVYGWKKIAVVTLIGPLGLLVAPLFWWLQRRRLANALAGKDPAAVVEMFLRDVNEMLASDVEPGFAHQSLSPSAREAAGDVKAFHRSFRRSLLDTFEAKLLPTLSNGTCTQCQHTETFVDQPSGEIRVVAGAGVGVRCDHCSRLYCASCAAIALKDQDKLLGQKFLCACGKKLASAYTRIIPRERLTVPFLQVGTPKQDFGKEQRNIQLEMTALYRRTGVSRTVMSGNVASTKDLGYAVGKSTISFPMRRDGERWLIEAVPPFVPEAVPPDKRWIELPDEIFEPQ